MNLDLDVGNSYFKWRVYHEQPSELSVSCEARFFSDLKAGVDLASIARIRVSSVRGDNFNASLLEAFADHCAVSPGMAEVRPVFQGLVPAYDDLSMLGVDRWLAMLAVRGKYGAVPAIIIDAGTALTVDIIEASGRHVGGYILPGFEGLYAAIYGKTQRVVNAPPALELDWLPGKSTQSCVQNGISGLWLSFFASLLKQYREYQCVVCGGDANTVREALLGKAIVPNVIVDPSLVLDGLVIALP